MNDLDKVKDYLIENGFQDLRGYDLQLEYVDLVDDVDLIQYGQLERDGHYIEVDNSMENSPLSALRGGVAQRFAHIVWERKFSRLEEIADDLLYNNSKRYRTLDERNADFEVILRGFGSDLLEYLYHLKSRRIERAEEDGLSIGELRKLLKIS